MFVLIVSKIFTKFYCFGCDLVVHYRCDLEHITKKHDLAVPRAGDRSYVIGSIRS